MPAGRRYNAVLLPEGHGVRFRLRSSGQHTFFYASFRRQYSGVCLGFADSWRLGVVFVVAVRVTGAKREWIDPFRSVLA